MFASFATKFRRSENVGSILREFELKIDVADRQIRMHKGVRVFGDIETVELYLALFLRVKLRESMRLMQMLLRFNLVTNFPSDLQLVNIILGHFFNGCFCWRAFNL